MKVNGQSGHVCWIARRPMHNDSQWTAYMYMSTVTESRFRCIRLGVSSRIFRIRNFKHSHNLNEAFFTWSEQTAYRPVYPASMCTVFFFFVFSRLASNVLRIMPTGKGQKIKALCREIAVRKTSIVNSVFRSISLKQARPLFRLKEVWTLFMLA